MVDLETAMGNLRDLDVYLAAFPMEQRSTRFEHLLIQSLSQMLRLPFYTIDNDDSSIEHRALWNGSDGSWTRAPGTADGVVHAYGFCLVVEATLKTGKSQFYDEFARSLEHYENFLSSTGKGSKDCYLLMVMTELNNHTYTTLKAEVKTGSRYVLLPASSLVTVLETHALAVTATHADFRILLENILTCCRESASTPDFLERSEQEIARWQKRILEKEKSLFVGVKSYKVLGKLGRLAGASEIFRELYNDLKVTQYFDAMGEELTYQDVENSLDRERLAYRAGDIPSGEGIYFPLPFPDVKARARIFIEELENAGASP